MLSSTCSAVSRRGFWRVALPKSYMRPMTTTTTDLYPDHGPVEDPEREPRFLEMVKLNFDKAAKYTTIDQGILEVIKACNSLVRVSFPLRRDNGEVEVRCFVLLLPLLRSFELLSSKFWLAGNQRIPCSTQSSPPPLQRWYSVFQRS